MKCVCMKERARERERGEVDLNVCMYIKETQYTVNFQILLYEWIRTWIPFSQ